MLKPKAVISMKQRRQIHMDDLELTQLDQFYGTEQYHNVMGVNVTDGVAYIMNNGYSWLVTDAIVVIKMKLKKHEFLTVDLIINKNLVHKDEATMRITDGNDYCLYEQHYGYTTARRTIKLFFTNNVLMLTGEY